MVIFTVYKSTLCLGWQSSGYECAGQGIPDWFEEAATLDANVNGSDFYSTTTQVRTGSKFLLYTLSLRTHTPGSTKKPSSSSPWTVVGVCVCVCKKEDYMQLRPLDQGPPRAGT